MEILLKNFGTTLLRDLLGNEALKYLNQPFLISIRESDNLAVDFNDILTSLPFLG